MWRHPITAKQIRVLTDDWGVKEEAVSDIGDSLSITGWFRVVTVSTPLQVSSCRVTQLTLDVAHQQVRQLSWFSTSFMKTLINVETAERSHAVTLEVRLAF